MSGSRSPSKRRWRVARRRLPRQGGLPAVAGPQRKTEALKDTDEALRRNQADLAEARRNLQLTIDTIPVLVDAFDRDGARNFVNRRWQEYTGVTLQQATAEARSYFHADDADAVDRAWRASLARGVPLAIESRIRRSDGVYRWHSIRRAPLRDDRGQITNWYGIAFDIEEQKRTEAALSKSQVQLAEAHRELQLTIDSIPALVVTYQPDGTRDFVNQTWRNYTGLTLQETMGEGGEPHFYHFHPEDTEAAANVWQVSLTNGVPHLFEGRLRRFDGAYRWHAIRRVPLHNDKGDIVKWYAVGFEIEDQKFAEQALRRSETELARAEREIRLTLDTIPTLAWRARADGFAEYLNKRWLDYTGLSLERALGWQWQFAIHPEDRPKLLAGWQKMLADENPTDSAARMRCFDGTYRWFLFRPAALRDEGGKLIRWYGTNTDIEDRKRAESALQRSEAFLAEAQRLSRTGSFGWNVSTGEIFWSEETFRIFGHEPATNVTLDLVLSRVHPDDLASVQRVIDRVATHREAFDIEHRLQLPDGSVKHLHVVTHALVDEPENQQFAGAVMDITAHKETEHALRHSERRYQNLFQAMAVAFFEVDYSSSRQLLRALRAAGVGDFRRYFKEKPTFVRDIMRATRIVDVNDRTVALFGRGRKEELLTSVESFWPEESLQDYVEAVLASIERNQEFSTETRMRRLDGTIFDAHFTLRYASEDKKRGLAGVIDITARKQAFLALEKSEQRYRHLFHNMPVALWQLNAEPLIAMFKELRGQGVGDLSAYIDDHPEFLSNAIGALMVEEVNDYTVQLFGARTRQELLGPTHWTWANSIDTFRRAMESRWRGEELFQETTKLVTRDGRLINALFTAARPQTIEGLPISLISVIDLTEQVRAEEELQRVRADFAHAARISMLGELTASVAHEVNQPLAAIAAGGEASLRWLARPTPDVDEVQELTKGMVADARRASEIIARIRAVATRRAPEPLLLSLDDVIGEALLFLRHEVESRGVAVSHFAVLGPQKVLADRTQLQQVIVNLAVNAMQAMAQAESKKRNLTIRTVAPDPTRLRCSVEDSGPGIEPRHETRLFDSFFSTKDGGMGMGLRICRSVIEAHGGRIEADNGSSHGGARFSFTLPVASA
jgi:PAS domain S-box-containing protein